MAPTTLPGGTFTLAGGLTVPRMGYGAMQLAGPGVFGPPKDPGAAAAVLRGAMDLGIRHIDTADFYGPHVTNVLRNLGLEVLDVVNLRVGGGGDGHSAVPGSVAEPFGALAELRAEGLIRHLGISTADAKQVEEAQSIAPVVCVQNFYNVARRDDDGLVESLAAQGIAYVPYFPLGGFSPLQSATLTSVAGRLSAAPLAIALAWLLHRSPNILLIPGTSSVSHLHDNVTGAALALSAGDLAELDALAS